MLLYDGCTHRLTITSSPLTPGAVVTAELVDLAGNVVMSTTTLPEISSGVWRLSIPANLGTVPGRTLRWHIRGVSGDEEAYINPQALVTRDDGE